MYWRVQVDGHSAQCDLMVSASAFSGDKDAAERVASRIKDHIASSSDRSDASLFWGVTQTYCRRARSLAARVEEGNKKQPIKCRTLSRRFKDGCRARCSARRKADASQHTAWEKICYLSGNCGLALSLLTAGGEGGCRGCLEHPD